MKITSFFNVAVYSTLFGISVSLFSGCGGGKNPETNASTATADSSAVKKETTSTPGPASEQVSSDPTPQSTAASSEPEVATSDSAKTFDLVLDGVWYGESVYDVDAVNARLAQLDPQQAAKLEEMVSTFSSIVMAAEFRPDKVMELDMMITMQDGQQMRDRSVGTWSVRQSAETRMTIETKEYRNQNQNPTEKVYAYQFIDKDRFQFVPDSISPDLREFSPKIIFQRVEQPLDDAAVAQEPADEVVR